MENNDLLNRFLAFRGIAPKHKETNTTKKTTAPKIVRKPRKKKSNIGRCKIRNIINSFSITREKLVELINDGLTTREIAAHFNCGQTNVRHYLNKYSLKTNCANKELFRAKQQQNYKDGKFGLKGCEYYYH